MTTIYTKSGDNGTTALGGGVRVLKSDLRVESYGTVDELNSILGVAASFGLDESLIPISETIQNMLFEVGADLAFSHTDDGWKPHRIQEVHVKQLETWIDELEADLPELKQFILPGGSQSASFFHYARTVCRRAERLIVDLVEAEGTGHTVLIYMNRLSDLLFVMARLQNQSNGIRDVIWKPNT